MSAVTDPKIMQSTWRIDPDRSSVEFTVKHLWGIATVKGRFSRYEGTLNLSGEPAIELIIEADSLDTKNKRRDKHLRSPDFFAVEQHPYARFLSESASLEDERFTVRGVLHVRGASLPLEIDATLRHAGDELEIEAVTVADHRALGHDLEPDGRDPHVDHARRQGPVDPMSDLQVIADRVEIEALRGEFTDAVMMRDYDRLASLFTADGAVRMPHINAEANSRKEIRAGIERMQDLWDRFVQNAHPGTIRSTATPHLAVRTSQNSCTGAAART